MSLELSKRHEWVLQSEIRNMSIECDRMGGINLSQGVCDTEVPLEVRLGAQEAMNCGINTYTRYDGLDNAGENSARFCFAKENAVLDEACRSLGVMK